MEFVVNDGPLDIWISVGEGENQFVVPPENHPLQRLFEEQDIRRPSYANGE